MICRVYKSSFFLVLGIVLFSPVLSFLQLKVFNLPIVFPELFVIPLIFLVKGKFKLNGKIYVASFLLLILACLGLIINFGDKYGILASYRSLMYVVIAYSFFRSYRINYKIVYLLSLGSILGWILIAIFDRISFSDSASYGVLLTIPVVLFYTKEKLLHFYVMILIIAGLFVLTMLRRVFVVELFSLFLIWLFFTKNKLRSIIRVVLFSVGVYLLSWPYISQQLGKNWLWYYRIIGKTSGILNGDENDGDLSRIEMLKSAIVSITERPLPGGLLSKQVTKNKDLGRYIDMPLLELVHVLGGILFTLLFLWILYKIMFLSMNRSYEHLYFLIMILFLLFIDGTFYMFPFSSLFLGLYVCLLYEKFIDSQPRYSSL